MTNINEPVVNKYLLTSDNYKTNFWNYMKGDSSKNIDLDRAKHILTGTYPFPLEDSLSIRKKIESYAKIRSLATNIDVYRGSSKVKSYDSKELASFISDNENLPIYNGLNDVTNNDFDIKELAVIYKIDEDILRDDEFNVKNFVIEKFAHSFAKAEDKGFIIGNGTIEPTGLLHATKGATLSHTTTNLSFDDIIKLYFSVDSDYRDNAVWFMNDSTALKLRTLKDSDGNSMWNQASDTILSKKVVISNYVPNDKPVLFGDFSYYWILNRHHICVRTIHELFSQYGQIGFLGYEFIDGLLVRKEAIKYIKISN